MEDLHLALWQTPFASNPAEALQRLDAAAAQARAQGADLFVTPEMHLTGYAIGAERVAALAEPADGPLHAAQGCLQDVHWSGGMLGYFPTYALGNQSALRARPGVKKTQSGTF